jgi:hypothetical protein
MIVAVHQPHYLPWPGYIDKVRVADIFVFLDDAQFEKGGWQNRNYVVGPEGRQLLTVPVRRSKHTTPICRKVLGEGWRERHWRVLQQAYARRPYWPHYRDLVEASVRYDQSQTLGDLAMAMVKRLCDAMNISTEFVRSSALGLRGRKSQRLVDICGALGAGIYLSGSGAKEYLDTRLFAEKGVSVWWQDYSMPPLHCVGIERAPMGSVSVLDYLMCYGPETCAVLGSGSRIG